MVYKGLKLKLELQLPQYQHRKKDIQRPTSLINPGFIKTKRAEQCFMFKILRKKIIPEYYDVTLNMKEDATRFRCAMAQMTLFF